MFAGPLLYRETPISEFFPFGVACLAIYLSVRLLVTRYFHLNTIPGPWWAPYTRLWLLKCLASEDAANVYVRVNQKYGLRLVFPCARTSKWFQELLPELDQTIFCSVTPRLSGKCSWFAHAIHGDHGMTLYG